MIRRRIDELDFETFKAKVEKLQKQAEKFGLDVPQYRVVGETFLPHPTMPQFTYKALELEIDDVNVVFDGWRVVCQIKRVSADMKIQGKVIGNAFYYPMEELPEFCYEKSPTLCEHCGKNIPNRLLTFILKNDATGEYKQVGSTCVEKFVSDARNISSIINFLNNYTEYMNNVPQSGEYSRMRLYLPTRDVLRIAVDILQKNGWVSRWDAEVYHKEGSVETLMKRIMNQKIEVGEKVTDELLAEIIKFHEDRLLSYADAKTLSEADNFKRNCSMQIINHSVEVEEEELRYILVGARDYFAQFLRKNCVNEFCGNIGDVIHDKFVLMEKRTICNEQFGDSLLVTMCNHDGLRFKTFANKKTKFAQFIEDKPCHFVFECDAKIKAHNEYKGDKTTMLFWLEHYSPVEMGEA